jgi:hypothetical protein
MLMSQLSNLRSHPGFLLANFLLRLCFPEVVHLHPYPHSSHRDSLVGNHIRLETGSLWIVTQLPRGDENFSGAGLLDLFSLLSTL